MRHTWCIEPVFAEQHLPLVNAYVSGQLSLNQLAHEEDDEADSDPVSRVGYAVAPGAVGSQFASTAGATQTRYALDDPELPDGSVFVLDIRGTILKEDSCCAYGTEAYCAMLERAYAHESIVCLVDSPGGQLSGTPTLYDLIRDPRKPTVSVVNEGLMASAAYWLACGSDFIYATRQTDQIGSIGVYVTFQDTCEMNARLGIKTVSIYSDRSSQKNKPFKDALAGDDSLMREDLNQAADLFREAVEQGRGERLKAAKKGGPDVFEGGLFYAGKAIELGLIDGYGNLATAVAKVVALHQARQTAPAAGSLVTSASSAPAAPAVVATAEPTAPRQLTENLTPPTDMFGFVQLAAPKGMAAADVTDAQIEALNAELAAASYGIAAISQSQSTAVQTVQNELAPARSTVATRDTEITRLTGEVGRLGAQPGAKPTQAQKVEEVVGSSETEKPFFSETDAELAKMKGAFKA